MSEIFTRKELKHYEYLVFRQHDDLIDEDRLRASFLKASDKLGLKEKKNKKNYIETSWLVKKDIKQIDISC